jgi:hypothetical protein
MIIGDILTFASIYVLLLFGFSLGFYYLYKNIGKDVSAMGNYPESLMLSFQMTLGEFKVILIPILIKIRNNNIKFFFDFKARVSCIKK